ncbi:hypothetical protein BDN72DRAFT_771333, partial [Pluteus cervinus]
MSSTQTTTVSDQLPSTVPKLESSGVNWAIFSYRFEVAVQAKNYWKQFDGTTPRPQQGYPITTAEQTALDAWEKDERIAKSLLTQKIPDSTVLLVKSCTTVHKMWETIKKEYTIKGAYAQTDLRTKFLE